MVIRLLALGIVSLLSMAAQDDRATIRTMLTQWQKTHVIDDSDLQTIKKLKNEGLPILAHFLPDKDLGFLASGAMNEIDAVAAAPFLIRNLPNEEPNAQRDAFRSANLLIHQYELFKVAGSPKPDATNPPPRWPTNTSPYPYKKELHAAAIESAHKDNPSFTLSEVAQSIGLTGNPRDLPILKNIAMHHGELAYICLAAEARLGDKAAISEIESQLRKPIKGKPAEDYVSDNGTRIPAQPGAVIAPREDGERIRIASWQAAYTMNRRFIPLLLQHLDDPNGQRHGDYSDPSPGQCARDALSTIVFGREYSIYSAEDWKRWAKAAR